MPVRPRSADPAKVRAALTAQWRALLDHAERLTAEDLDAPSRLPGWTVRVLVAHIENGVGTVPRYLAKPVPEPGAVDVDLAVWAAGTATVADGVSERARAAAVSGRPLADTVAAAEAALAETSADRPLPMLFGVMRLNDFLVTRLVEAVVHADDLDPEFPHDRAALATVVRTLAELLAARAPGHAVELRIPPYAVVQCVHGPRHTRGTPPNVVETDPLTWLRLATGRLPWAEALALTQVAASGDRADLAPYLPLLR